ANLLRSDNTYRRIVELELSLSRAGFNPRLRVLHILVDEDLLDHHGRRVNLLQMGRVNHDRAFHGGKPKLSIAGFPAGGLEGAIALPVFHPISDTISVASE